MDVLAAVARLLLTITFVIAGSANLADLPGSRQSLIDFGLPAFLAQPFSALLPVLELACAIALIPLVSVWFGAVGVLALLLLFIAGIAVNMARGRNPECHCFG